MEITLNLTKLKLNKLTPDQAIFLFLLLNKDLENLKKLFTKQRAIEIKNSLLNTKYVISEAESKKIKDLVLSTKNVQKLFGIRSDNINFYEFYNCYPVRVNSRILRAKDVDTVQGRKHQKKYFNKIKTIEEHKLAIKATEAFIAKKRASNSLQFLPAMETVLNNAMWESWVTLIEKQGTEGQEWNEEIV